MQDNNAKQSIHKPKEKEELKFQSQILKSVYKDFINNQDEAYPAAAFLDFERYFTEWDHDCILLEKWEWTHDTGSSVDLEPYVYISKLGIYEDINTMARALQHVLGRYLKDFENGNYDLKFESSLSGGDELHIRIPGTPEKLNTVDFVLTLLNKNQRVPDSYPDGIKFSLSEPDLYKDKIEGALIHAKSILTGLLDKHKPQSGVNLSEELSSLHMLINDLTNAK